ncbi:hypothetical protein ALC53_06399 [Atta colombica]|uniref:Uncharacterized protein n=1 Tax=Atta colombica TaxID=520822 RepID=A0A195BG24_9HYME|nr:hypothetical protein ALC53_06399 [Atta colombica]
MKSDDMLKDRIRECPEYDCFTTVALSCHREIVPEHGKRAREERCAGTPRVSCIEEEGEPVISSSSGYSAA